jgi:hypothetical protein
VKRDLKGPRQKMTGGKSGIEPKYVCKPTLNCDMGYDFTAIYDQLLSCDPPRAVTAHGDM